MKRNYLAEYAKNSKIILRVTIIGIVANIVLVALKLTLGLIFDNLSVLSDALHSATDLFTSLFIIVAVFISKPKRDKKHNYGHEKIEPLFILFFALAIAGAGALLAWQGIKGIISPKASEFNWYLVSVTIVSLCIKEALFWYGMHYAKKTKSEMLKADAWHSRSDSLSSVAVLIGLVCSFFISTNIAESIAVLVVSIMIAKIAFDIFRPAVNQLIDKAASEEVCNKINDIAITAEGVDAIDSLRTRVFGNSIYVDIVIAVDGDLHVDKANEISRAVHDSLESEEDLRIKHCVVSIVPSEKK